MQVEKGYNEVQVNLVLQRVLRFADQFEWLQPPEPNRTLTVADILKAETPEQQAEAMEAYARDIWLAWQVHRVSILKWLAKAERR